MIMHNTHTIPKTKRKRVSGERAQHVPYMDMLQRGHQLHLSIHIWLQLLWNTDETKRDKNKEQQAP